MNFRKAISLSLLALALLPRGAAAVTVPVPSHDLTSTRHSATVTLLPDGNILVVGGISFAGATLQSAEMYITSAASFSPMSNMQVKRSSHTATLLGNGKVLVAGGFDQAGAPLDTAEIFDPINRTWETPITMYYHQRGAHTANLLNSGTYAGGALLCGGYTSGGVTDTCEIYSPVDHTFVAAPSMVTGRMNHTSAALDSGNIFISGGINSSGNYLASNEIYVAAGGGYWIPATALLEGRAFHTATVMNTGDVMIAGGFNGANSFLTGSTEDWYAPHQYADPATDGVRYQDAGSHGFLHGVEFFDPNGGRVPVNASSYSVMPYRTSHQAAILGADGRVAVDRGYGNMIPTFFNSSPACLPGTYLNLSPTTNSTANILPTSSISFPLSITLQRPVSGRILDGDIFFSGPKVPDDSLEVETFSGHLSSSVVRLDGYPVGNVTGEGIVAGQFYTSSVTLRQPVGTGVFDPLYATDSAARLRTNPGPITMNPLSLASGEDGTLTIDNMSVRVNLDVPVAFRGGHIRGTATITGGTITDGTKLYTITLTGGTGAIPSPAVYPAAPIVGSDGKIPAFYVYFTGITADISNTTDSAISSGKINFSDDKLENFSITLNYTSDLVWLNTDGTGIVYNVDVSSFVTRKMIFSTNLGLNFSNFQWNTTDTPYDSSWPLMDQSYAITPTGDEFILGGRNCEYSPAKDCTRLNPLIRATSALYGILPVPSTKSDGGWGDAEPLNHKRAYHTSTLLPNGRILTCGGSDGISALDSCEVTTSSGTWSYTGSMTSPRARHTATLLPNGSVLLAGGSTGTDTAATDTAEIYYPDTGRSVATQRMNMPRLNHTATLLPDGNVLAAGGSSQSTYSATAELYITTAATWQMVGKMNGGRAQHTSTLLLDGRVLVAGGINGAAALPTSNIYNPANRSWTSGPTMNNARYAHTATLLRDGRVLVVGGSNGYIALKSMEFCNYTICTSYAYPDTTMVELGHERANHKATLLTSGKVLVTGGETSGSGQKYAEMVYPDLIYSGAYGEPKARINHTAVLDLDGYVHVIGGWDGTQYLDTTQTVYSVAAPDVEGMSPSHRNPVISTATAVDYLNRGERLTLTSGTTNFHGLTEANGGGTSNSSFSNPRMYLQAMDAASGFLLDISTYIYTNYSPGINTNWQTTRSSITISLPAGQAELPWGYYYARAAANGQYSNGRVVQITTPRPTEIPTALEPLASPYWRGTSSITWQWTPPSVINSLASGYNIYSSTSGVFIATTAITGSPVFTQTGLSPNTKASVMVNLYNLGGSGPLVYSSTYYTLAAAPSNLVVTGAGFNSASLAWNTNGNSANTAYEVTYCPNSDFLNTSDIRTAVYFSKNLTSSFTVVSALTPNVEYYFRVQARNGAFAPSFSYGDGGVDTAFSNSVSTLTVASIINLEGVATSSVAVVWSWTCSDSKPADFYSIYDVTADTNAPSLLGVSYTPSYDQINLSPNTPYRIRVVASVNGTYGTLSGPASDSGFVYSLAEPPAPGVPAGIIASTNSMVARWQTLGNSSMTIYNVELSTASDFSYGITTISVVGSSAVFSGLTPNVLYYAQVKAVNGDGMPTTPAIISLGHRYTLCAPPANVRVSTISMSGVTLTWDQNGNADNTYYQVCATTQSSFDVSFSTIVEFRKYYYGRSLSLNGLLTDTDYRFNVEARNGDGADSGRTLVSPAPVHTSPGPAGAPAGCIGGASSPSSDVTFSGLLPNGRYVEMNVPSGAFPASTGLAISSSSANRCSQSIPLVALSVYSQNGLQPETPVTLKLNYTMLEANGLNGIAVNAQHIVLARYNPVSGECLPLDTQLDTGNRMVTATLNHFSDFQLIVKPSVSDLASVRVYPNPLYLNRGNGYATIEPVPANSKIRIYTLSGDKVWEGSGGSTGVIIWRGVNKSGQQVASGIYLAVIDSTAGKKTLKVAVER